MHIIFPRQNLLILLAFFSGISAATGEVPATPAAEPLCEESPLTLEQRFSQFTLAARYGDEAMLEEILPTLPNPLPPRWSAEGFREAIDGGQTEIVDLFLRHGLDGNARSFNRTPLQFAVQAGNRQIVRMLLAHEADLEVEVGDPLIVQAVLRGHPGIVEDLLAESNEPAPLPPLHLAATLGQLAGVREIVESGAAIDEPWGRTSSTPLELAARSGHAEVVDWLLKNGASAMGAPGSAQSPLALAARHGHAEVVATFFRHGKMDVDLLQIARSAGSSNLAILRLLQENGLNLAGNPELAAQLLNAAISRRQVQTVVALREWDAPIDVVDSRGIHPIAAAMIHPDPEILAILREDVEEHAAPATLRKYVVEGALQFYSRRYSPVREFFLAPEALPQRMQDELEHDAKTRTAILQEVLNEGDSGVDPRREMVRGMLLWNAVERGFLADALWLLAQGANPNFAPPNQSSALSQALGLPNGSARKTALIQALLNAQANPDGIPSQPDTPLFIALQSGCINAAKMLVKAGTTPRFTEAQMLELRFLAENSPSLSQFLQEHPGAPLSEAEATGG